MKNPSIIFLMLICLNACSNQVTKSDAYGNFEATTTTISAESNGKIIYLDIQEGEYLETGDTIALIDTTSLHLQRLQLKSRIGTIPSKLRNTIADINVLQKQKSNIVRERDRLKRLVDKKAATSKQLDDANGQVDVIDNKIAAIRAQTKTSNRAIISEKQPLLAQMELLNEQVSRSFVVNPISGTVLNKLAETHEMTRAGSPLYRIGKLDTMTLRFYADAVQLQSIQINQKIEVLIDQGVNDYTKLKGTISWISNQSEFTPKTIQTKKDRVNLVYAVKAFVPNPDGLLKMGMPAEVNFNLINN